MQEKYIESMKKIHNRLFEFLVNFKKAAEENGITYYLVGGAAVGALREGDFLDWDDDLDIIIKEEDAKKFSSIDWSKYGWSIKNPVRKRHAWFTKLYLLDTKIKSNGIDDVLFVDIFLGFKKRKIGKIRELRMIIIDYIMYIKSYKYKDMAKEYGQIWRVVKFIFDLIPFSNEYWAKRFGSVIKNAKIISEEKRKFYVGYDFKLKNHENHYLLRGNDKGHIRGLEVPVPYKLRETTMAVFKDLMIPPEIIPQKPDHDIQIVD